MDETASETGSKARPNVLSRRKFIKGAAKLVTGVAVAPVIDKIDPLIPDEPVEEAPVGLPPRGPSVEELGLIIRDETGKSKVEEIRRNLKEIEPAGVFEEMFPNLSPDHKKALKAGISSYQKIMAEGGVGTLEEFPSMERLLNSQITLKNGEVIKFNDLLTIEAKKRSINPNIIKGLIFVESHGKPDAKSPVGAVGIGQFMPDAGERYGLVVRDKKTGEILEDYRTDPFKSVVAICRYLEDLRIFSAGNIGIAVGGYHAGEGNSQNISRDYILAHTNPPVDVGIYRLSDDEDEKRKILNDTKKKIKELGINEFFLKKDPAVRPFLETLEDDTDHYAIKAAAAAEYFEKSPLGRPI